MGPETGTGPGERSPGLSVRGRRAVVLGGYGLIGSAVMRRLAAAGYAVTGVGRSERTARLAMPGADWIIRDIPSVTVEEWRALLNGVDVVVNASGALQDGARDDLEAIHETAVARLAEALCGTETRVVQISAAGVSEAASTEFLRTKARGDAVLRACGLNWVILRPTLVLAPAAYGGTALLRAAAAVPLVLPRVFPGAIVQTVHIEDLAEAVLAAADGRIAAGQALDVTGPDQTRFPGLISEVRRWLGLPPAKLTVAVPSMAVRGLALAADAAGWFGWRSPLRTNAILALRDGVTGDPDALPAAGGPVCRRLADTLGALPSTLQERWFARAYLAFPVAVLVLSIFWIASGLIGLMHFSAALEVLTARSVSSVPAALTVTAGGLADIVLGAAILWRPWVRRACLGMIGLSIAYLLAGSIAAPDLWADPLGPYVKVIPGIGLALFALALADER